jgi:anti-anti-sigma regulatory factor
MPSRRDRFDPIGGIMSSLELQELHRLDGACILTTHGTIDESTVDAFEQGLAGGLARSRRLVVDLTSCTVSSCGLAAILRLHRTRDRLALTLVARDACLLRMLDAVGVSARVGTYPTVSAALNSEVAQAHADTTIVRPTQRPRGFEPAFER